MPAIYLFNFNDLAISGGRAARHPLPLARQKLPQGRPLPALRPRQNRAGSLPTGEQAFSLNPAGPAFRFLRV